MSWRKKADLNNPDINSTFANWLSQLCMMLLTKFLYLIAGRGSAKTTEIQVERLIEIMYDMPGAPVVWVSDTYANLHKNVLPMVMEGLERKGYIEGVHYVIGKVPPQYTEEEKESLPKELRPHFWKPYNKLATYKHTMIMFTGLNITFGSLDRPASLAGRSYIHVFGDEVKYFPEHKIGNLLKAVRGYRVKYGNSIFYRGQTFTTDMPDITRIGEYDWILRQGKKMRKAALMLVLKAAFITNEALGEFIAAQQSKNTEEIIKKRKIYQRWKERWEAARRNKDAETFFFRASSYVNVDILTPEWFDESLNSDLGDHNTAVLSMRPSLESGERFYANLGERHFYHDGSDTVWQSRFGILDQEDCRILKYHNINKALEAGMDFGNMISMMLYQEDTRKNELRVTNFIYTLSPEWIREIADKFLAFYQPQREKTLHLHYDRAANNYREAKQDLASQMKKAIEEDKNGKRTGWRVILMSEGQGNIFQNEEYIFMQELFSGHNKRLPIVLIDYYRCKPLRCSLELTRSKKNTKGQMVKDKSSERLPIARLPLESSNPSDAFKYGIMTRARRRLIRAKSAPMVGDVSER